MSKRNLPTNGRKIFYLPSSKQNLPDDILPHGQNALFLKLNIFPGGVTPPPHPNVATAFNNLYTILTMICTTNYDMYQFQDNERLPLRI